MSTRRERKQARTLEKLLDKNTGLQVVPAVDFQKIDKIEVSSTGVYVIEGTDRNGDKVVESGEYHYNLRPPWRAFEIHKQST